jgi:hypothetical protein
VPFDRKRNEPKLEDGKSDFVVPFWLIHLNGFRRWIKMHLYAELLKLTVWERTFHHI